MPVTVAFSEVTFGYGGDPVLSAVDLTLSAGEFVVLAGPNGSGKSTLFNVITGVYKPDGGTITFRGRRSPRRPWRRSAPRGT